MDGGRASRRSPVIGAECRKNLLNPRACVREMKSYVNDSHDTYTSHSAKARQLRDDSRRMLDVLLIQPHARPPRKGH